MEALANDDDGAGLAVVDLATSAEPCPLLAASRFTVDMASLALRGSSMTIVSAPRPVKVPPIDVAIRLPPAVSAIPDAVSLRGLIRVSGNNLRYQSEFRTAR